MGIITSPTPRLAAGPAKRKRGKRDPVTGDLGKTRFTIIAYRLTINQVIQK